ncbi:MAG: GNAT family N-acetyltransferase [Oscillospiraceae bacterium]|nr:GNAT family N-acetyltransferase [Oscillospiraceae bacterium]
MLITVDLDSLDFLQLKAVYAEGIEENGAYFYPNASREEQLALSTRDFWEYLTANYFLVPENRYWIWKESGQYISALRLEAYSDGLLLEALETRPAFRQKGFAKKLIEAVLKQLPSGTKVYSQVSKHNVASLATHNSCGFSKVMDFAVEPDGTIAEEDITLCKTT